MDIKEALRVRYARLRDMILRRKPVYRYFKTDDGQEMLLDLMERTQFAMPSTTTDPMQLVYREGQRNLVLYMMGLSNYSQREILAIVERAAHERKLDRDNG